MFFENLSLCKISWLYTVWCQHYSHWNSS